MFRLRPRNEGETRNIASTEIGIWPHCVEPAPADCDELVGEGWCSPPPACGVDGGGVDEECVSTCGPGQVGVVGGDVFACRRAANVRESRRGRAAGLRAAAARDEDVFLIAISKRAWRGWNDRVSGAQVDKTHAGKGGKT